MKKLIIEYIDGEKTTITNKKKNAQNYIFSKYIELCAVSSIKTAILYTYPLKNNEPLIIIRNGKILANIDQSELSMTTIHKIENVLGFKLYDYQINHILNNQFPYPEGRRTGYTTSYCIKLLLSKGEPIDLRNFNNVNKYQDAYHGSQYTYFFKRFLLDLYRKLNEAGIKTRKVLF